MLVRSDVVRRATPHCVRLCRSCQIYRGILGEGPIVGYTSRLKKVHSIGTAGAGGYTVDGLGIDNLWCLFYSPPVALLLSPWHHPQKGEPNHGGQGTPRRANFPAVCIVAQQKNKIGEEPVGFCLYFYLVHQNSVPVSCPSLLPFYAHSWKGEPDKRTPPPPLQHGVVDKSEREAEKQKSRETWGAGKQECCCNCRAGVLNFL